MAGELSGALAVMDADIAATQRRIDRGEVPVSHYDVLNEKREARATVAELIAADEVYDIALSRYFAAFSDGPNGDFGEQREAQTMLRVAKDRRDAALARVQGGTP